MKLINLRLTKKQKKDTMEVPAKVGEGPEYPYGTRLNFETEQIEKIPALAKVESGDMVSGTFEGKIIDVRTTDREKEQKRRTVEIQIQSIGIVNKESFNDAFEEAGKKKE